MAPKKKVGGLWASDDAFRRHALAQPRAALKDHALVAVAAGNALAVQVFQ